MKIFVTKIFALALLVFSISRIVSAEEKVSLSIVPGKNWKGTFWLLIIPQDKTPQLAAWIETPDGVYVSTLLASSRASKKDWYGSPENGRPESLPVWYHAIERSEGGSKKTDIDAATSATPSGDENLALSGGNLVAGKEYIAYIEVNHSFDYNDSWPKKAKSGQSQYSGVNGQPSVIYAAKFIAGAGKNIPFAYLGQGSIDGSSGTITPGTTGLTSALTIIASATLSY